MAWPGGSKRRPFGHSFILVQRTATAIQGVIFFHMRRFVKALPANFFRHGIRRDERPGSSDDRRHPVKYFLVLFSAESVRKQSEKLLGCKKTADLL
jgi:hypothetical protein